MGITILGGSGFIGNHLTSYLSANNVPFWAPQKGDSAIYENHLGDVIYCIGLTADFRSRPFDTIEAHICFLKEVLTSCQFDSLVYLSSTRIYEGRNGHDPAAEGDALTVNPNLPGDLYNISKLAGESLCHAAKEKNVKIARLANVYGGDFSSSNFITDIINESLTQGRITLKTSMDSFKDYVNIDDAIELIVKILTNGKEKVYNVASGINIANAEIVSAIQEATGCTLQVKDNAPTVQFPSICIQR